MNDTNRINETSQALVIQEPKATGPLSFFDPEQFKHLQRLGLMFCKADLVPKQFQGDANLGNTVIALEMAQRLGASALAVMQQIYIVYGKPAWSSKFVIACLNTCGRFEPLMFDLSGTGDARGCIAWTVRKGYRLPEDVATLAQAHAANVPVFEGPACTVALAKAEGWWTKNGSKWPNMTDLMLRYRAATWFGSLYAPELLMGMSSIEEIHDTASAIDVTPTADVRETLARKTKLLEVRRESDALSEAVDGSKLVKETEKPKAKEVDEVPGLEAKPGATEITAQRDLQNQLEKNGVTFDDFRGWLCSTGTDRNGDSYGSWDEVPTKTIDVIAETKSLPKIIKIYGQAGKGAK